jgi:hypothetical protein
VALATSNSETAPAAAARSAAAVKLAASVPLTFNNPLLGANVRDLGDIACGSNVPVTFYLRASGGMPPYIFQAPKGYFVSYENEAYYVPSNTSNINNGALMSANYSNTFSVTQPSQNLSALPAGKISLTCTVADSSWAPVTGAPNTHAETFNLNVTQDATFRFASDKLCDAQTYSSYVDKIRVINGSPPYYFFVNNITLNGQPVEPENNDSGTGYLESVGLSLAADGTIFGRPYKAGTLQFDVYCEDSSENWNWNSNWAYPRNGNWQGANSPYQTFTIQINPNCYVSSDMVINKLQMEHYPYGVLGLYFIGMVNLHGHALSDLQNQDIELRVGNYRSPNLNSASCFIFDDKGKIIANPNNPWSNGFGGYYDKVQMSGTVSDTGLLKIKISDPALADSGLSGFFESQKSPVTRQVAVLLRIGTTVLDSNFYGFSGNGAGSVFTMSTCIGGDFMLLAMGGKDDSAASTKWVGRYLLRPYYVCDQSNFLWQPVSLAKSQVQVRIGAGCLAQDARWSGGEFLTRSVPAPESGIPPAITWPMAQSAIFGLQADFFDSAGQYIFSAVDARCIFAKYSTWTYINPYP